MAYHLNIHHNDAPLLQDRAPIVALHSSASDRRQWSGLAAELSDRHDVFTYNLPGYGPDFERCGPEEGMQGMAEIALPVLREIAQIGEPVHLVGHSFGGGVALKIALMRPDLIKSLTLYEPVAFHLLCGRSPADDALVAELKTVARSLEDAHPGVAKGPGLQPFIDFWNGAGAWNRMPEKLRQQLSRLTASVHADFVSCFAETWVLEDLSRLEMPLQLLTGMESPEIAQRTATLIFENTQDAELVVLPGLGHMAPIHAPDWVNPRIRQHIARVERSAEPFSWPATRAA